MKYWKQIVNGLKDKIVHKNGGIIIKQLNRRSTDKRIRI